MTNQLALDEPVKQKMSLFVAPYLLLIMTGVIMPSDGNHGLFTLKSQAFLFSVFSVLTYLVISRKFYLKQLKLIVFMCCAVTILLFWLFIGFQDQEATGNNQFDQFKVFAITLSVVFVSLYWVEEKLISCERILRTAIYANLIYSFSKVLVVTLHLFKVISIWRVMELTGVRFMTMGIYGEVMRLQTSVDIITPFLMLFVLQSTPLKLNLNSTFKRIFILVSWLAILLSFSRYLIFVAFLSHVLYWCTLNLKRIILAVLVFSTFVFAGVCMIGFEATWKVIERRLFSKNNYESDQTRIEQVEALFEEHLNYCYMGKGLGGYTKECIRDPVLKHSYEVQWMAFLLQFGIIGILLVLIPPGLIAWNLIHGQLSRIRLSFFFLFLVWLLSGFTNPLLISLTSGIVYSLFLIVAIQLTHIDLQEESKRKNSK